MLCRSRVLALETGARRHRRAFGALLGLFLCSLFTIAAAQMPPAGTAVSTGIRGRIVDSESREPVSQVEVVLRGVDSAAAGGSSLRVFTDAEGWFAFERVEPGRYALVATRLGYRPLRRDGIDVRGGAPTVLELAMPRSAVQLEEITVTPGVYSIMSTGTSTRQTMSREDIESVPQLGEDVFRAVNRLPGLSSGDYSAHFSIRGGRHDETLILLDGLELFEPYHLKDFNEGAISIIDTEAIDGVQLMTGGFPAQYGNKRSGVFDITSRTPETDRVRASVGLSFMNARAMASGPLGNHRGSWLASARSGYMDLVFNLIKQNDLPSPRYHDVFAKLNLNLSRNQRLTFDLLHAGDRYTFEAPSTTGFLDTLLSREDARNHYGNSYVWATLYSALGAKATVRTLASAGFVTRSRDGSERVVGQTASLYEVTHRRDYRVLGLKQDWTFAFSNAHRFAVGIDLRDLRNDDTFRSIVYRDPNDPTGDPDAVYPITANTGLLVSGTRLGVYLSHKMRVLEPWVIEAGARYDRASYTGDADVSPRVSSALTVGHGRTLRVGWGQYRQIQGIDDIAVLNDQRRYFPSELSEQWTAGLEQVFANGAHFRVEGYRKEGSHLRPVFRNWKGGIDTFPEINEDRILVFPKSTSASGVEFSFDQKLGKRIAARASYAYSSATEEVDRIVNVTGPDTLMFDRQHPVPQDQPHAAHLDLTYRLRDRWSVNGSLAYHGGWPSTHERLVSVTNDEGQPELAVRPETIYGERLPGYMRFDVRATRRWTTSRGDMRFFVELVNLTNHANVFGYDYFRNRDGNGRIVLEKGDETWFTILPSLGVAWSRRF